MDDDYIKHCSCDHPTGFTFIEYTGDDLVVWQHIMCGGIVVRPVIRSESSNKNNEERSE